MSFIVVYAILILAAYCSFKLAKEKGQNHIIWPILTILLGPSIFVVKYLATTLGKKSIIQ